ncbi:molybdate ABC transporter substrate-binding protein [Microbulbifer elongatus]|uniref:Molybdate ABC transporter substrate-binding protein n=1 Tax=Microbulbifer elongatus TaxID=86173 RepID=A0ABT1P299_9GAMM|nr:molybdate ABC transporter substrate-binding protein [Microbulbifer elongatus]MCQ3830247.1 molybdate ABC transporter substrate-binding protein [Microbulbifer elongatus]
MDHWIARTLLGVTLVTAFPAAHSDEITIAVASNFSAPMGEIVSEFEASSDHRVRVAFGSSGKLFAQIRHGAPFAAFFSADPDKVRALLAADAADASSRYTYALGRLVLWTTDAELAGRERQALEAGKFRHLAIANPRLAPYGAAALQVIDALGLAEETSSKRVVGENIAQTYQYVASGNAQLGMIALSQVFRDGAITHGSGWLVPDTLHQPIQQDAIILKRATQDGKRTAVDAFWTYLQGPEAQGIIESYGYRVAATSSIDRGPLNAE